MDIHEDIHENNSGNYLFLLQMFGVSNCVQILNRNTVRIQNLILW